MKQIRESKFSKILAYYLMIMMFLQVTQPMQMFALTSGPTQPEFNSFTPIGTSDMVDLASGDFNYNIPVMDVGGYPLNLAYNSGITMDQEASWTGLGWNLNVGQIERQMRGLPDDFRGDQMTYENDLKDNNTVGMNFVFHPALFGTDPPIDIGLGIGVQYNNYEGITFKPSFGISYELTDNVSVGANFSSSVGEGASVRPSVSISNKFEDKKESVNGTNTSLGFGVGLNSRKGVENMSASASVSRSKTTTLSDGTKIEKSLGQSSSVTGSISFNNLSYTPTKRVGYKNGSYTFDGAFGVEIFGVEGQAQLTGYGSYQGIAETYKNRKVKAFGYENTQYKNDQEGVLDFNREKEQAISPQTTALPVTNYTYDIYTIQGQGVGGMFRPYRSQVSNVYNDEVVDYGESDSFGVEIGAAELIHGGVNFNMSPSTTRTGRWNNGNNALPYFNESNNDLNKINYEPFAYKLVGEMNVDNDQNYINALRSNKAVRFHLDGGRFNWQTTPIFKDSDNNYSNILGKIKRTNGRLQRNQTVQKITKDQAKSDPQINLSTMNSLSLGHHTAGMKVLQANGTTYVYGETAYNIKKVEATFDVSKQSGTLNTTENKDDELVDYNGDVRGNGNADSDRFVNRTTTPAYAHSFLLSSVLSTDYEDVDANGPTDNDLGSYTKFSYTRTCPNYKWRVPYKGNKASYNEGLRTNKSDEKGNYLYGEKELKFLKKIETKTHVAYFDIEDRKDAVGVDGEAGGMGSGKMKYLKSIRLYAKSELKAAGISIETGPNASDVVKPIKTAFFEYDYSLCKGTPSNNEGEKGKLTLKKLYFTYRNSNMGKFTPYVFDYSSFNPNYKMKANDIWGNYKPISSSGPTNSEYPFVEQNPTTANQYTGAWTLKSVKLPSGGVITINTESDDYQYVQNKKAMQMFKVVGFGDNANTLDQNTSIYQGRNHKKYVYVKISDQVLPINQQTLVNKYLSDIGYDVYFRFLLNMTGTSYDYVSGYFNIDYSKTVGLIFNSGKTYAAIPVSTVHMGGGVEASRRVSPFAKTGWSFGRKYLNRQVYSLGGDGSNKSFTSIVSDLVGSIGAIFELFTGPNKALEDKGCAQKIIPENSWIRLQDPDGKKLGGGLRVKSVELSDDWDVMTSNDNNNLYKQKYGQQYSYALENGSSSGVATFEPNSSPENPFVKPYYAKEGGFEDALGTRNYIEEPFGENFFPSPTVTYSKVTVSNLNQPGVTIIKHGTGKVVTEHYTSKDFPTIVRHTDLDLRYDENKSNLLSLLNVYSTNHITGSQGFAVETNDMNGKIKKETVYQEGDIKISGVEYLYNIGADKNLNSEFTTINSNGEIKTSTLGVTHDLITDFNESKTNSETMGADINVASMLFGIFPLILPTIMPKYATHENLLHTATTTKVTHKTGVLVEKVAYDLGSRVSTKSLAWDAGSGDVLLSETTNEYNDHYYSFNYPAYWKYEGMGMAGINIGMEGYIKRDLLCDYDPTPYFKVKPNLNNNNFETNLKGLFQLGDELIIENRTHPDAQHPTKKVWVLGLNASNNGLLLIDKDGAYIDDCGNNTDLYKFTLVRSGYRNLQTANMASVTSMINPIRNNDGTLKTSFDETLFNYSGIEFNPRIINASAVVYNDFWRPQDEADSQVYPTQLNPDGSYNNGEVSHPFQMYNPYLRNVKGDWRAEKSYAYLTSRKKSNGNINNPRNEGFYNKFSSFYQLQDGKWAVNEVGWQFASSVTQFSPYGAEIENKDALDRYSSAQYGYNYTLPMAVGSNAKYNEIGFEGFEETQNLPKKHFGFTGLNTNYTIASLISSTESHTGKRSVKVTAANPVKLVRKLNPLVNIAQPTACNYNCSLMVAFSNHTDNYPPHWVYNPSGPPPHYTLPPPVWNEYKITPSCPGVTIAFPNIPDIVEDEDGIGGGHPPYAITNLNNGSYTLRIYNFVQDGSGVIPLQNIIIPIQVNGISINLKYYYPYLETDFGMHGCTGCVDYFMDQGNLTCQ